MPPEFQASLKPVQNPHGNSQVLVFHMSCAAGAGFFPPAAFLAAGEALQCIMSFPWILRSLFLSRAWLTPWCFSFLTNVWKAGIKGGFHSTGKVCNLFLSFVQNHGDFVTTAESMMGIGKEASRHEICGEGNSRRSVQKGHVEKGLPEAGWLQARAGGDGTGVIALCPWWCDSNPSFPYWLPPAFLTAIKGCLTTVSPLLLPEG